MAVISDISDEPKFTIKQVSFQTGILPVTLRAWERRYTALSPQRGENRYRLYSERDVAILRWLKNRVDSGVSISSAVSEFRAMTHGGNWPEAILAQPETAVKTRSPNQPPRYYARALYQALVKHDEEASISLLKEVNASFDLRTAFQNVITPALIEIGEAWYRGEIRVTTEHFASSFVRGRLLSLLHLMPSRRKLPPVLIGCAPSERHEISSLMLAVLLREEGYRVEYLGPDIPLVDLADYAGYQKPAMIILSATMPDSAAELRRLPPLLKTLRTPPLFGYGGAAFNYNRKLCDSIDGHYLGETIEQALQTINQLLGAKKAAPTQRSRLPL